ncbi:uncharacterized protein [Bemisia tabaci]|uniref:uncharacterized protein n=1 Tax=Bemisia tabaci TaxID=7038 RepID=UPI0008F9B360|nr:PREDICTED: uncharacterized protein LOC109039124 [Bemisia tabaci]
MIFVGYCKNSKGYRLIDPQNPKKVTTSRDVIFLETSLGAAQPEVNGNAHSPDLISPISDEDTSSSENDSQFSSNSKLDDSSSSDSESSASSLSEEVSSEDNYSESSSVSLTSTTLEGQDQEVSERRFPTRIREIPKRLADYVLNLASTSSVCR